jgi:hypothetical protein
VQVRDSVSIGAAQRPGGRGGPLRGRPRHVRQAHRGGHAPPLARATFLHHRQGSRSQDGSNLSTRRIAGIWPHLRVHSSPEVGPGASVGTSGKGYLLLGCPGPPRGARPGPVSWDLGPGPPPSSYRSGAPMCPQGQGRSQMALHGPGPLGRSGAAAWRPVLRRRGPSGRSGFAPTGPGPPGRSGPPRGGQSSADPDPQGGPGSLQPASGARPPFSPRRGSGPPRVSSSLVAAEWPCHVPVAGGPSRTPQPNYRIKCG